MEPINLLDSPEIKNIHFVGIGGVSMSGLAEILHGLGYNITGSDIKQSTLTQKLHHMGINIFIGHRKENIQNADLIVYTAAVKQDNPEIEDALRQQLPMLDRATLLGQIMKQYSSSIAVSGTHGKTTTTSMITLIMLEANLNPTVHIGAELDAINGNTRIGGNEYFIAEACEYVESFLKFHPTLGVILNIELDHVDYFKDISHIKNAFLKFAKLIPENGHLVACADDQNIVSLLDDISCHKITYGVINKNATWSADQITYDAFGYATYALFKESHKVASIKLNVPGIHNVNNSLAAIAACDALGCDMPTIISGISKFTGAHRRFELKGVKNEIKVIDDYAHHPTEVMATLSAAKNSECKEVWCVFQPHTYTRTKSLLREFTAAFNDADHLIIADIYAAREKDPGDINASMLAKAICETGKKAQYISHFDDIICYLKEHMKPGDLLITMGAGDINKVGESFLKEK